MAADKVPPPYHGLLVHDQHMTVTVEAYHGSLVNVRVLEHRLEGDVYARKILLALQANDKVVQLGSFASSSISSVPRSAEIVSRQTPLGRILIEHNVLRTIEPTSFLRCCPASP